MLLFDFFSRYSSCLVRVLFFVPSCWCVRSVHVQRQYLVAPHAIIPNLILHHRAKTRPKYKFYYFRTVLSYIICSERRVRGRSICIQIASNNMFLCADKFTLHSFFILFFNAVCCFFVICCFRTMFNRTLMSRPRMRTTFFRRDCWWPELTF